MCREDAGGDPAIVDIAASILGDSEDFDGLPTTIEDAVDGLSAGDLTTNYEIEGYMI